MTSNRTNQTGDTTSNQLIKTIIKLLEPVHTVSFPSELKLRENFLISRVFFHSNFRTPHDQFHFNCKNHIEKLFVECDVLEETSS